MTVMDSERAYELAKKVLGDDVKTLSWPPRSAGMAVGLPTGVRMTHQPTGLSVIDDYHRHQYRNACRAAIRLAARVELANAGDSPACEPDARCRKCDAPAGQCWEEAA